MHIVTDYLERRKRGQKYGYEQRKTDKSKADGLRRINELRDTEKTGGTFGAGFSEIR